MGTRSMNALVVASPDRLNAAAIAQLVQVAITFKSEDGSCLWVWETNITPFWARSSVRDLQEEVAIFDAVMQLPRQAYCWVRAGEDAGKHGDLRGHPLLQHQEFLQIMQEFQSNEPENVTTT